MSSDVMIDEISQYHLKYPVLYRMEINYLKNIHHDFLKEHESDFRRVNTELALYDIVFNYTQKIINTMHEQFEFAVSYPKTFRNSLFSFYENNIENTISKFENIDDKKSVVSGLVDDFNKEYEQINKYVESFKKENNIFKIFTDEEIFDSTINILSNTLFANFVNRCVFDKGSQYFDSLKQVNDFFSKRVVYITTKLAGIIKDSYLKSLNNKKRVEKSYFI